MYRGPVSLATAIAAADQSSYVGSSVKMSRRTFESTTVPAAIA
jgi:hypothetical protein